MPPPRRASRRVRSAVPDPFAQAPMRMSVNAADALFGGGATRQAHPGLFRAAIERVKTNTSEVDPETDELTYTDDAFTYDPTASINPPRPRTRRAGWVRAKGAPTGTIVVQFREGAVYEYNDVPYSVWRNFRRVKSPGRLINRTLNHYPYRRVLG